MGFITGIIYRTVDDLAGFYQRLDFFQLAVVNFVEVVKILLGRIAQGFFEIIR